MLMNNKILVTGGLGYIGSHTVVELINLGYYVIIVDNLSNSDLRILDGIKKITNLSPIFYNVDVTDFNSFNKVFTEHEINTVIHFAAYKAVGESVEKPIKYYRNNLMGIINLLELMQKYNINNFVFSSSCTVYGQPSKLPVTENTIIAKASSPYGNTKIISEQIISDQTKTQKDLRAISLRYFNPIGAHKSALIGELPLGIPNNLIPFITQTAIGKLSCLNVFGNDYNTPDGTAIRDYINVVDLAKAHIKAVERLMKKESENKHDFFNIGTGNGLSVLEIINCFENVTKKKLPYKIVARRKGDIEKIWADTKKANEILLWKPEISLKETLISAWNWEKKLKLE